MTATTDIVQKLWGLCNVLRDDGVTYLQYVTELTYLLFLKMMQEKNQESLLPEEYRWDDLVNQSNDEILTFYRSLLVRLGDRSSNHKVQQIFSGAQTSIKQPKLLRMLVTNIDGLD